MKRKIIVAILAVTVIVSTLAAPLAQVFAAENDKDITGTWTGSSMGIPMEMTVNDDGTYQISVDGGNKETGSWVLKDKDFIMDMDSDYELNMKYNGDSIFVDSSDIDIGFCKTPANVKTDEQKTDVSESDFNGVWKVDTVEFEKLAAGPDAFGITDMFADIKNGYVNLYITGTNISDPVKLNDIQAELNSKTGTITFDIPKDEATNEVKEIEKIFEKYGIEEASQIAESKWTEAANILSGLNINPIAISESAFSQTEELIYQIKNALPSKY